MKNKEKKVVGSEKVWDPTPCIIDLSVLNYLFDERGGGSNSCYGVTPVTSVTSVTNNIYNKGNNSNNSNKGNTVTPLQTYQKYQELFKKTGGDFNTSLWKTGKVKKQTCPCCEKNIRR